MGQTLTRLRNIPRTPLAVTALVMGVLVLVWITARGEAGEFPDPVLNAVGLLLTALVFVLALAQGRLHRTADAAVAEVKQLEETLLRGHAEHPEAVTTLDLWARAGAMREALFQPDDWSAWEKKLILDRARKRVGNWGPDGALDRRFELSTTRAELGKEDGQPGAPSPRRRRALERQRARLEREDAETRAADERASVTVHGYRRLRARVQVAELAVRSLVSVARIFSFLMLALVVLGGIYAGWDLDRSPPPELWPALVLIALAWVYSRVVLNDIDLEVSAVTSALRDLSLLTLYDAEGMLGHYWEASAPGGDGEVARKLRDLLQDQLDRASQRAPASHWLASLRGRFELVEAIRAAQLRVGEEWAHGHDERMTAHIAERLPAATRLLGFAATRLDDPGAALGYARTLSLRADFLEDGTFSSRPTYVDSDPARLHAAAQKQVDRALVLLRDLPLLPRGVFDLPHRGWFTTQSYLWPENDQASLRELKDSLLIEHDAPDQG